MSDEVTIETGPRKGQVLKGRRAYRYQTDTAYRAHYDGEPRPSVPLPSRSQVMAATAPAGGPGTELKALLRSVGIEPGGCDCATRAAEMDGWGVAGCKARRAQIVEWLREKQMRMRWTEQLTAGLTAVVTGLAWSLNPADPLGSLVDEAIRRAEEKAK